MSWLLPAHFCFIEVTVKTTCINDKIVQKQDKYRWQAVVAAGKNSGFTIFLFFCTGFALILSFLGYLCESDFRNWLQQSKKIILN